MSKPYSWQFNVFWQNADGESGIAGVSAGLSASGAGDPTGGYGFGGDPGAAGSSAVGSAPGGVRGGTAPGTGGFGGGSAVGPSVGSGVGGGIGGVVGGGGGGFGGAPTGGNAGGVAGGGGAGGGGGDAATLANQILLGPLAHLNTAGMSPTQIAQQILTPGFPTGMNPATQNPINIAGTIGTGGINSAAPVSPVEVSPLGPPSLNPNVVQRLNDQLNQLHPSTLAQLAAQFFGLTGGMGSIGGSTLGGEPTMGYPALFGVSPGLGGFPGHPASPGPTRGTPAPVGDPGTAPFGGQAVGTPSVRGPGSDATAPVSTYGNMPGPNAFGTTDLGVHTPSLTAQDFTAFAPATATTMSPTDLAAVVSHVPGLSDDQKATVVSLMTQNHSLPLGVAVQMAQTQAYGEGEPGASSSMMPDQFNSTTGPTDFPGIPGSGSVLTEPGHAQPPDVRREGQSALMDMLLAAAMGDPALSALAKYGMLG